ncbi:unnamed protein product [Phyllotreta striolata]|uniref:ATP synthase-coupling factor 6, mitochondrial n=1 Tax=Phyllotreta striolata TaxID=444603 RepID=A0A9N9XJR2_PHYSR|nr:unnamed protein product [Phyllotreta striolata]
MLSVPLLKAFKSSLESGVSIRNIGILAPCLQKASDPIQQLFVDKIREYRQKSNSGKTLVEPTPALEKELKTELEKVTKQYGGGKGEEMTKFPSFKFVDPQIDSINLESK